MTVGALIEMLPAGGWIPTKKTVKVPERLPDGDVPLIVMTRAWAPSGAERVRVQVVDSPAWRLVLAQVKVPCEEVRVRFVSDVPVAITVTEMMTC